MKTTALEYATIEELAPLLAKKKISPVELTELCLGRVQKYGPRLNAFITLMSESALKEARVAEREIHHGSYRGLLHGIPVAIKDNIWTRGVRTTVGTTILRDFVPNEDALVVRKLRRAGAVLLGKTNLHEFVYGVTGDNPHYGAARNPWDTERISGGSSSGSAVAVAAGFCPAALGSDTGGSIRVPAALCGIVGLKPTFGRISRHGLFPLALSFDHAGVLTRSANDAGLLVDLLTGFDPSDPGSVRAPRGSSSGAARKKYRLGWPKEFFWERLDPALRRLTEGAVQDLVKEGATLEEISLPTTRAAVDAANRMASAEGNACHRSAGYYPVRAAEYGADVRQRIAAGGEVLANEYIAGLETIRQARLEFAAALKRVDAIVAPDGMFAAPVIGTESVNVNGVEEPIRSGLVDLNRPANLTGLPAICTPCGFTREGLPVGLQLIGRAFDEWTLVNIAAKYERAHNWRSAHPPLDDAPAKSPKVAQGMPRRLNHAQRSR